MRVVYAGEAPPWTYEKSIYLAGPTPRSPEVQSWRPLALAILEKSGYDGAVFVPEPRDGVWQNDYFSQVEWEGKYLGWVDCILFWIPRDIVGLPGFTTNVEWGVWQDSGKVVFGAPPDAEKVRYLRYYAEKLNVPTADNLEKTIGLALQMVGIGALRSGGEREVPCYIWRTPHFQQWYASQKKAGNRLDGAKVEWIFRVGPGRKVVLFWALHVNVYVTSENRHKSNEVVISRPDIAVIVMYRKASRLKDTDIVLIREFRSPASTEDGFVWEAPGGSSFKPKGSLFSLAADECKEETGLLIESGRIRLHESRQLVATLSAHKAHLFSVEITKEELERLRAGQNKPHGVAEETERTYVQIMKLGDILRDNRVDWSMLGMILSVAENVGCNRKNK